MLNRAAVLVLLVLLAACQPAASDQPVPTLASLPSVTPSATNSATPEITPTRDPSLPTETSTPLPTWTPSQTFTPRPTFTASATATVDLTRVANLTATAAVVQAPRLATITPANNGGIDRGETEVAQVPAVVADIVVTEAQFQEQVNLALENIQTIQAATIDFVPDGIRARVTASGGDALMTGDVLVSVGVSGGFASFQVTDIQVNAAEVPEVYQQVIFSDFLLLMVDTTRAIVDERVGENNDLENIVFSEQQMGITLLVP